MMGSGAGYCLSDVVAKRGSFDGTLIGPWGGGGGERACHAKTWGIAFQVQKQELLSPALGMFKDQKQKASVAKVWGP